MGPRRSALTAALALLVGLLLAPAAHAAPSVAGFSAQALDEQGNVAKESYLKLMLPKGGTATGQLKLSNSGDKPLRMVAYPVDGLTGATSGVVFANRGDAVKETGGWLTPDSRDITLAPHSERIMRVAMQVPGDAAAGDHVGGIVFENKAKPGASKGAFAVKQVVRIAIAAQMRVEGPVERELELGDVAIEPVAGTQVPSIVLALTNSGDVLCKPAVAVTLSKDGAVVGAVEKDIDTLIPGDKIPYPLHWPKPLAAGTYEADVAITGCGPKVERRATLTLKDDLAGTQQAPGVEQIKQQGAGGIPLWAMGLVALAALFGGFLLARRRPRDRQQPPPPPAGPAPLT